jgi:putrescine transport system substrate-binding protein
VFDSNETLEGKLLAGRTGYDVVVPSNHFLGKQIKAGAFQKLDKSLLPNWQPRPGAAQAPGAERSGQPVRRAVPVGHQRHRLQRRQGQGRAGRRQDRLWAVLFEPENMKKLQLRRGLPRLGTKCSRPCSTTWA